MRKILKNTFRIRLFTIFALFIAALFFITPLNIGYADGGDAVISYTYNDEISSAEILTGNENELPSAVTLVGTVDLPPIDNQGAMGSCVSQAVAYMQFTNAVSRYIHANYPSVTWNPSSGNKKYIFSPKFTYTLSGSGTKWVYDILEDQGCLTLDKSSFCKDSNNSSYCLDSKGNVISSAVSWDVKNDQWFDALQFRLKGYENIEVTSGPYINEENPIVNGQANIMMTTSPAGQKIITKIKDALNKGNVVTTGGFPNTWRYSKVVDGGTYGKNGEWAIYASAGKQEGGHAVCIVGYDDNITTSVNGVTLKGAFLMANSWGSWKNNGYCWVMYDSLNSVSEDAALANYPSNRIWTIGGYTFTYWDQDIEAFQRPDRILKVGITAQNREAAYVVLTMRDNQTGTVLEHVPKALYYGVDYCVHDNYNIYNYDNDNSKWLTFDGVNKGAAETRTFYFSYQSLIDSIPEDKTLSDYTFGAKFAAVRGGTVSYSNVSLISDTGTVLESKSDNFTCVSTNIKERIFNGSVAFSNIKRLKVTEETEGGCFFNYKSDMVEYGDKFEFTISTILDYYTNHARVTVNGVTVYPTDGRFTIDKVTEDITICVTGGFYISAIRPTILYYTDDGLYDFTINDPGETIVLPDPPQKDGYVFTGWRTDLYEQGVVGLDDYFPETMPATSFRAYAQFEPIVTTKYLNGWKYLEGMENYNGTTVLLYLVRAESAEQNNDLWNNRSQYEWDLHFTWQESGQSYTLEQVGNTPTSIYNWNDGLILYRFEICNHKTPLIPKKNLRYKATLTIKTPNTIYEVSGDSEGHYLPDDPIYDSTVAKDMTVGHYFHSGNDFEYWSNKTYLVLDFNEIDKSVYSGNYLWNLHVTDKNGNSTDYECYPNSFFAWSDTNGLVRFPVFEFGWVPEYGGEYSIEFNVYDGNNKHIYTGSLSGVKCYLRYKIKWDVNGKVTSSYCSIGQIPSYTGTISYETLEEKYEHYGWKKELKPATADCTYVSFGKYEEFNCIATFIIDDETLFEKGVSIGSFLAKPSDPEKIGYTFLRWCDNAELAKGYDFEETKVSGNLVLYAKFKINTYMVAFDAQGGTDVDSQVVQHANYAIRPNTPEKEGYTFIAWYKDSDMTTVYNFNSAVTEDLVLYAKFDINNYSVSFDTQGGTEINDQIVQYAGKAMRPNNPTKIGCTFIKWCTNTAGTTEYDFNSAVTKDLVLYAKFKINTYTVAFDAQGGTDVDSQVVQHANYAIRPNTPEKEGYTFIAWYKDSDVTTVYNFNSAVTEDLVLYAKFDINNYSVSFDTQGGTEINDQIVQYAGRAIRPNNPTKTGCTFIKWCTNPAGTTEYDFNSAVTRDLVLYAKFNTDIYTVSFDTQGGTEINDQIVQYANKAFRPNNPIKTGSTFVGWYVSESFETEFDFETPILSDKTLYAKFMDMVFDSFVWEGNTARAKYIGASDDSIVEYHDAVVTEKKVEMASGASSDTVTYVAEYDGHVDNKDDVSLGIINNTVQEESSQKSSVIDWIRTNPIVIIGATAALLGMATLIIGVVVKIKHGK